MIEPVFVEHFYHDGRGPELREVYWANRGRTLVGIDYFNPDDDYDKSVFDAELRGKTDRFVMRFRNPG